MVSKATSFLSSRTQPLVRRFFSWFGINLYQYHSWFLLSGILLTIISAGAGALVYKFQCYDHGDVCSETRIDYLWIPRTSAVWSHYTEIIDLFGSYPSYMALLLKTADPDESMLLPSNLDIAYEIYTSASNVSLQYANRNYFYTDLCFRSHPLSPVCDSTVANFFGFFFNENEALWANDSMVHETINAPNAPAAFFLGGFEYDDSVIVGAKAMRFTYELIGSTNETIQEIVHEYMEQWQNYWAEHASDYAEDVEVAYLTAISMEDEINRVVAGDIPIFGLALVVMLVYLMFTLGNMSCIGARPWLACSAVFVMICALLMGFSISFCLGSQFNTIVMLVPFILLGVGVDDMIILVDSYDQTAMPDHDILNAHIRLGNALAVSGLSISLTSFCSSMAFFVGSATDIPGVSAFCMYAGWSFLTNYLLQFLIFVPLMVMDDKRIRKRQNFCCPCLVHSKSRRRISFFDPERTPEIISKWRCNASFLMRMTLIPCLRRRICRWITIFLFVATFCGSVYILPMIVTDSDATKLVPDDSYVLEVMEQTSEIYGGSSVDELQIVLKHLDFSDANTRNVIVQMMADMESQPDALGATSNWLLEFEQWLQYDKGIEIDTLSRAAFYQQLQIFANASSPWHSSIVYDDTDEPSEIVATRFELKIVKSGSIFENWPEYVAWNAVLMDHLDGISSDSFAFIPQYNLSFLSQSIVGLTIDNMIFAGCGIAAILLLLFDLRMALFIVCVVSMIDIHLFGWMWLNEISLDTLSYAQCLMAVGLTVDYVIHIVHAISEVKSDGNTPIKFEKRLSIALSTMGASVCKGAFTTFLGATALLLSKSAAFRIFFYMFSGIILIAVAHGMILTPALLGELWFVYLDEAPSSDKAKTPKESDASGIVANLTIEHAHTKGNSSNISRSDLDQIYTEAMAKKDEKSSHTTIVALNDTEDGNAEKKKAHKETQDSIQMGNYNDKDSDESSSDQFKD